MSLVSYKSQFTFWSKKCKKKMYCSEFHRIMNKLGPRKSSIHFRKEYDLEDLNLALLENIHRGLWCIFKHKIC